jgi:signal transduction histidine kinase
MQAIDEAIAHLNATIDEMRDVARLQVGQTLDLQLEDLDVGALVRAVAAGYGGEAGTPRMACACTGEGSAGARRPGPS